MGFPTLFFSESLSQYKDSVRKLQILISRRKAYSSEDPIAKNDFMGIVFLTVSCAHLNLLRS